ncbi:hypothetical protein QUF79_08365 [Fictibacillus enclensis]|uniref:hypothetical protein n=1 Tax=Fictibacillus enclensis TaxID=1017270 RepID=UPI0025A30EDC|nr:hypothetical protein [Fictibacillus enclensis]MDM5198030.1 hypothetical protein [Fictibacillus enclensis]
MGEASLKEWHKSQNFLASATKEQLYLVNLTDLEFSGVCRERYGVNKGLYNTIEDYFSKQGIRNILYRRLYILEFLNDVQSRYTEVKRSHLTFGTGGLARALQTFFINRQRNASLKPLKKKEEL